MLNTLFSPSGRINPADFQQSALILIGIGFVLAILPIISMPLGVIGGLLSLILLWPWICILMKRARDAGKSGWFCLLPILALIVLSVIVGGIVSGMYAGSMTEELEAVTASGDLAAMMDLSQTLGKKMAVPSAVSSAIVSLIVAFGYNALLKQDGDNKYGPAA